MKKFIRLLFIGLIAVALVACSGNDTDQDAESKALKVGVAAGPYGDLFTYTIQPLLEEKGYTVEIVEFTDYVIPNQALAAGEIDINLFQHLVYLENFKTEHNLDLSALAFVPTAGAGIYSNTITSLDDVSDGAQVTISNDVTNQARALRILQAAGLITLDPSADPSGVTPEDVAENPHNLEIIPIEAPQTPRALDSAELSVVNGNYAIGANLDLSTALYTEILDKDLKNVVAIRTEDVDQQLGIDLLDVLKSDEHQALLEDPQYIFRTFQKPDYQLYD